MVPSDAVTDKDGLVCNSVGVTGFKVLGLSVMQSLFGFTDIEELNRPFYSCWLSDLALNGSEAGVDLVLIQHSLLLSHTGQNY